MLGKSLRSRALIIVLGCIVGLAVLAWCLFAVLTHNQFLEIEKQQVSESVRRVKAAFESEAEDLRVRSEDWAYWDDAIEFVQKGNDKFVANLTEEALAVVDVDVAIFANSTGEIKLSLETDPAFKATPHHSDSLREISERSLPFIKSALAGRPATLITTIKGNPFLLAVVPILTSEGSGPVEGYVTFGRAIDQAFLEKMRRRTRMNIQLWYQSDPAVTDELRTAFVSMQQESPIVRSQGDNKIHGFGLFKDFLQKPVIYYRVEEDRPIFQESLHNSRKGILFFLSGALIIGVSMMWLLESAVINRIIELGDEMKSIQDSRDISRRVNINGLDEIEQLANSANFMLASLESSQSEIKQGRDLLHEQAMKFAEQVERLTLARERVGHRQQDIQRLSTTAIIQVENFSVRTLEIVERLGTIKGDDISRVTSDLKESINNVLTVCNESKIMLIDGTSRDQTQR